MVRIGQRRTAIAMGPPSFRKGIEKVERRFEEDGGKERNRSKETTSSPSCVEENQTDEIKSERETGRDGGG